MSSTSDKIGRVDAVPGVSWRGNGFDDHACNRHAMCCCAFEAVDGGDRDRDRDRGSDCLVPAAAGVFVVFVLFVEVGEGGACATDDDGAETNSRCTDLTRDEELRSPACASRRIIALAGWFPFPFLPWPLPVADSSSAPRSRFLWLPLPSLPP